MGLLDRIGQNISEGIDDAFSSPENIFRNQMDPGAILFGGASRFNSIGMRRDGDGDEDDKLIDWLGAPQLAGTQGQSLGRAAAIVFGAYMAWSYLGASGAEGAAGEGAAGGATGSGGGAVASDGGFGAAADAVVSDAMTVEGTSAGAESLLADAGAEAGGAATTSSAATPPPAAAPAPSPAPAPAPAVQPVAQPATTAQPSTFVDTPGGAMDMHGSMSPNPSGGSAMDYQPPTTGGGGILNNAMNWIGADPLRTFGTMQIAGSAISGVANSRNADKQRDHDRDMLDRRQEYLKDLELWRQRLRQSGSYFDATINMAPSGQALTRPDGSPVFRPGGGLVAGGMN